MTALRIIKSIAATDAMLTATNVAEADYAAWNSATTYAALARVILTSTHKVYESLLASNLNKNPATQPLFWAEVGPTNRWKLFDLSTTTQTNVGAANFYELTPHEVINSVALINISGILTVRVRLTDPNFGVVFDQTADLSSVPTESTWYAWFFEPRTELTQFVLSALPSYVNATLRVDVTSSGSAFIGALVFGNQKAIGLGIEHGVRLSINDYSRKERNSWGDTTLVQRAFAKRASVSMMVKNAELDNTYALLASLRATPCLWIGSDTYQTLSLFGFYNNFEIGIAYPDYSDCSIDIESLT